MSSGFLGNGIGPSPFGGSGELPAPVPVAGAELLTNGGFDSDTVWTKQAGWTISDGAAHHTPQGSNSSIYQNVASTSGWYRVSFDLVRRAGSVLAKIGATVLAVASSTGSHFATNRAGISDSQYVYYGDPDCDIDNSSLKPLTLSSLLSTRPYGSANCDLSAAITRTAGTQAGFVARLDSATSPANFIIAYLDGAGNVKVDKCVGGTYTNVISGAVTYSAGATLRLVCNGTAVSAYYNGAFVGTAQVTDAGIVSNTLHGLFSTYASNTFAGYVNLVDAWVTAETAPVPVAGAELLTNGGFDSDTVWTKQAGWTISDGAAHHTPQGSNSSIYQNVASTSGWYRVSFDLVRRAGSVLAKIGATVLAVASSTGSHFATNRAGISDSQYVYYGDPDCDIDNSSLKPLTLSSLLSTRPYGSANCDLSAAITRTAGTQAGLVARLDSATSPANFIIAYLDGAGNVKVDKCVGGTYTNVISGAVTYAAGRTLRLVCSGNNVSAYYDGTQVGSTVTVSDAGIVSNTRHGLFSTYASNSFAGYVAA